MTSQDRNSQFYHDVIYKIIRELKLINYGLRRQLIQPGLRKISRINGKIQSSDTKDNHQCQVNCDLIIFENLLDPPNLPNRKSHMQPKFD